MFTRGARSLLAWKDLCHVMGFPTIPLGERLDGLDPITHIHVHAVHTQPPLRTPSRINAAMNDYRPQHWAKEILARNENGCYLFVGTSCSPPGHISWCPAARYLGTRPELSFHHVL